MESTKTVRALAALAHDSRLAIYRLLVPAGEAGLPVGAIAEQLEIPAATLSFHLAGLRHAGLVTARRQGRTLYQAVDYRAINDLVAYLLENCCGGADCGVAAGAPAKPGLRSIRQESRHAKTARTRRRC